MSGNEGALMVCRGYRIEMTSVPARCEWICFFTRLRLAFDLPHAGESGGIFTNESIAFAF
ncbi:hypothetical protein [Burkholderia anthina]|uniref:hypothetical protein n=1 Tax=Burkholderia anthina TaxID=179879 RepID=UPI00158A8B49|nr:hypothetical protein [Burkholderia anthina]